MQKQLNLCLGVAFYNDTNLICKWLQLYMITIRQTLQAAGMMAYKNNAVISFLGKGIGVKTANQIFLKQAQ